jgi:hypothetical protein
MYRTLAGVVVMAVSAASLPAASAAQAPFGGAPPPRPVHTYSVVACDPQTGELGVAVQSHWFSVGPIVPWAEAGVGAVATQSFVEPSYGPLGLELMRAGKTGPEALRALLAADAHTDVRQVAMIDARCNVEAWTGGKAVQAAGHRVGKNFSVQANLMRGNVWDPMAQAFEAARGDLAERMLAALEATSAGGSRRRSWWWRAGPPAGPGRTGPSTCAWRTTRRRWRSCGGWCTWRAPTAT